MTEITRFADKAGLAGTLVSAMSCGACFPALASLGTAIGIGFLQQYEGIFVTTLLPVFATLALIANVFGLFRHRQWRRGLLGIVGPSLVLLGLYVMGPVVLYTGIAFMLLWSIWDLVFPASRRCSNGTCELLRQESSR